MTGTEQPRGRVVALGFFDGVHRGHRAILQKAAALAADKGLECAAVTFETHPRAYVLGRAPDLIVPFARRYALLQQAGAALVVALPFDRQMAETTPEEFAALLRERYRAQAVVCGENYRFGCRAAGTPEDLRRAEDIIGERKFMQRLPRTGFGYDVHKLASGRRLILCGKEIPWEKGLDGHSDADVLTHAIMAVSYTHLTLPTICSV